jgi:hypothetical protein
MLLPGDPLEFDRLTSNFVLAGLFTFLVPVLSLVALAAGTAALRERAGQIGLALGLVALFVFAMSLGSLWVP